MSSLPRSFLTLDGKVKSDELLRSLVLSLSSVPESEFLMRLLQKIDDHFDCLNSNDMTTLKRKNKSALVGAFFEDVCFQLCKANAFERLKIAEVWMFSDFPLEKRREFALGTRDMGIDLVAHTTTGKWLAIQCKYRRKPKHSHAPNGIPLRWSVPWKDLSTFYSLCERTGPPSTNGKNTWFKRVVMTSATSVNRQGRKNVQDVSVCQGSFRNIPKHVWMEAAGLKGHSLTAAVPPVIPPSSEAPKTSKELEESRKKLIESRRMHANTFLDRLVAQGTF